MDIATYLIVGFILPLYILVIVLPSFFLNGLIVLSFFKTREIRTPSSLLAIHMSIVSVLTCLLYSPIASVGFTVVMTTCNCTVTYYQWFLAHLLHFGVYPLNLVIIAGNYLVNLKFASVFHTFRRVGLVLSVLWIITLLATIHILVVVPEKDFTECCTVVCTNHTALCDIPTRQFTPHRFDEASESFFAFHDIATAALPIIMAFMFTAISYYSFKKSITESSAIFEQRMLLLPLVKTTASTFLIIGQVLINWHGFTVTAQSVPGNTVFFLFGLFWDINGVVFAILALYVSIEIRKSCLKIIQFEKMKRFVLKCCKNITQ